MIRLSESKLRKVIREALQQPGIEGTSQTPLMDALNASQLADVEALGLTEKDLTTDWYESGSMPSGKRFCYGVKNGKPYITV